MTTNIYDRAAKVVAADSRWSIELSDGRLWFVDDTGYDKLHISSDFVSVFAGDAEIINQWKIWLDDDGINKMQTSKDMPITDETSVAIIDIDTGEVCWHRDTVHVCPKQTYLFSGTGAGHAFKCWSVNFCYKKAIETAGLRDACTGGSVREYNLSTKSGNVSNTTDLMLIKSALIERGFIMRKDSGVIPFRSAAANEPVLNDLSNELMTGRLTPTAPSHDIHKAWTEDERESLFQALSKFKKQA